MVDLIFEISVTEGKKLSKVLTWLKKCPVLGNVRITIQVANIHVTPGSSNSSEKERGPT